MTFLIQSFQIFRKRFVTCLRVLVLFVLSLMYLAMSSFRPEIVDTSRQSRHNLFLLILKTSFSSSQVKLVLNDSWLHQAET